MGIVCALVLLLAYTEWSGEAQKTPPTAVEPVSLPVVGSMVVMPQARNYACLTGDLYLSCFFTSETGRMMDRMVQAARAPFMGDIDFGAVPEAESPEPDAANAEDDPAPTTDSSAKENAAETKTAPILGGGQ